MQAEEGFAETWRTRGKRRGTHIETAVDEAIDVGNPKTDPFRHPWRGVSWHHRFQPRVDVEPPGVDREGVQTREGSSPAHFEYFELPSMAASAQHSAQRQNHVADRLFWVADAVGRIAFDEHQERGVEKRELRTKGIQELSCRLIVGEKTAEYRGTRPG